MLWPAEILHVVTEQTERQEALNALARRMIRVETLKKGRQIANALKAHSLPTDFEGENGYCRGWVVPDVSARERLANGTVGRQVGVALLAGVGFIRFTGEEGKQYVESIRDLSSNPDRDDVVWSMEDVDAGLTQAAQALEEQAELHYYGSARQSAETQRVHAA